MEGILKVSPEKLMEASSEFGLVGNKIRTLTEEMMSGVNHLKGTWQGEASDTYSSKFNALQADMDKMHRMIQEHVTDLQEMAKQYQTAETANMEEGSVLETNIFS